MNNVASIVIITLFAYWAVGMILFILLKQNETFGSLWGMGLLYVLVYILFYPVRAINSYNLMKDQYRKAGISKIQYIFGKRPKNRGE